MNALSQNTKITVSDINTLISECNSKINSGGGNITGSFTFFNNWGDNIGEIGGNISTNNNCLRITGGEGDYDKSGAVIQLFNRIHSSKAGFVEIRTDNGTNTYTLTLTPTGTLTWGGNNIITSAGGTINGDIDMSSHGINAVSKIEITAEGKCGYIDFHYNNSTADFTSRIIEDISGRLAISNNEGLLINGYKALARNNGFGLYERAEVGTSVNMDNPGFNGFFEMRSNSEVTYTGTKPFDSFAPMITLNYTNCALQIGGTAANGYFIRGKQMANPTLSGVEWSRIATFNTSNRLVYPNGTQMWIA